MAIPVHMVELLNKIAKVRVKLAEQLKREATHEEIADALGVPISAL